MQLHEIMTRGVETISGGASVQDAAKRMAAMNIGFFVVADDGEPAGVVTDRDICVRIVAEGRDAQTAVEEAMTPLVEVVDESMSVEDAAMLMKDKQIRRLVVRGADGRLAGVVSLGDIACDGDDEELAGHALEGISEPAAPIRLKG